MAGELVSSSSVANVLRTIQSLRRPGRSFLLAVLIGGGFLVRYWHTAGRKSQKPERGRDGRGPRETPFTVRLQKILSVLFSGRDRRQQLITLGTLTVFLVLRTLLSIQVAVVTGEIAQYIVEARWKPFLSSVLRFALIGVPAAIVNSGLKYCTKMLALRFRRCLTEHINRQYVVGVNFYKANQLPSSRIENVDQRITADVESFCTKLADLYSSIFKPILDIVLNTAQLSSVMGLRAPVVLFAYYIILGNIKNRLLKVVNLKQNTQRESELQGDYRTSHQRLITYAEEIAFFEGSAREQNIISATFKKLFEHTAKLHYLDAIVAILDQYNKYAASLTGYALLCLPSFFPVNGVVPSPAELTRSFVLNRQLLMDLATGIAVLLSTTTKISAFSGITARVSEVLERVKMLQNEGDGANFVLRPGEETVEEHAAAEPVTDEWLASWRARGEELRASGKRSRGPAIQPPAVVSDAIIPGFDAPAGRMQQGATIQLVKVSIVSPDGRLLIRGLDLEVPHGRNIMVTGPNGCGKSSLFRVLGDLWPPYAGTVTKPPKEDIVFVPQKPYLVMGTLRDQIIYPQSQDEMAKLGVSDADLARLLDIVDPARSILNEWRWDDERNWSVALSGGQKQRVAMARVFYHRPRYAILDECTSAVSSEVEGKIYITCRKLGITLFTVSHRKDLQQYHEYQLQFDGHSNWKYLTREETRSA